MENHTMEAIPPEHAPYHAHSWDTFEGHILPGALLMALGFLWTYNALFRYHVAHRQAVLKGTLDKKLRYKNILFSKYHSGRAHAAPVEAIVLLLIVLVDCIFEIATVHPMHRSATMVMNHLLIYFLFGLTGVVHILQHYKFALPPSCDYVTLIIANAATAFILLTHLTGRPIVNQKMLTIMAYFHIIGIVCVAFEMMQKRSVTAALGRTLIFIVQGIWMCAIGVIVHPLPFMHTWDLTDHVLVHVISTLGVGTFAIALLVAFAMSLFITRRVRDMNLATANRIVALTHCRRHPSGSKDEAESPLISNSDDEF